MSGDPTTLEQARAILERYGVTAPRHGWAETPEAVPGEYHVVTRGRDAPEAAAARAAALGYSPQVLECDGEAREVGRAHAALALAAAPGTALISGGELTVTVRGQGRGGPNLEYALAAAIALRGRQGICGLAADTDGIDGSSEAAGAYFDGGLSLEGAQDALAANDSARFFAGQGGLFVTGPTSTNVNDLRIILTSPSKGGVGGGSALGDRTPGSVEVSLRSPTHP